MKKSTVLHLADWATFLAVLFLLPDITPWYVFGLFTVNNIIAGAKGAQHD